MYVLQADAWLRGRLDIPRVSDAALFGGRYYAPFPPFPALVLLPMVAAVGAAASRPVGAALALWLVGLWAARDLLRRQQMRPGETGWLLAGFFLGTASILCLRSSLGVWFFAHVVSFVCLLLAVREALGPGRGAWVGLFLGASFLSRQMTLLGLPFFLAALWRRPARARQIGGLLGMVALCVALYLGYNALRFGSPFETGYGRLELRDLLKARAERYGLFHPAYVPFNAAYLFLQGPHIRFDGADHLQAVGLDPHGTALPAASPFLLAVFFGEKLSPDERRLRRGALLSAFLIVLPTLFYYNNGYLQVGAQRFTMDFLPLLLAPAAWGMRAMPGWLLRALVLWAVFLNALFLVWLPGHWR